MTNVLKRASNSAMVLIIGKWITRGAGYRMELPCEFKFQGDKLSCGWFEEKLERENFDVL